ncbi:hypothetical protein [Streptomyces sclerotialus]|uniref:hypothetical protein n=1 Tax=Streptomyces sclerotialus TaxID=1957 RepID=UPI0004C6581B
MITAKYASTVAVASRTDSGAAGCAGCCDGARWDTDGDVVGPPGSPPEGGAVTVAVLVTVLFPLLSCGASPEPEDVQPPIILRRMCRWRRP